MSVDQQTLQRSMANNVVTSGQRRGIRFTVAGLTLFMVVVLGMFINKITTPRVLSDVELRANGTVVFDKPRILSDFELVNQRGESVGPAQLAGHWSLLFFGFTACPDVCPATLSVMRDVKASLDDEIAEQVRFVLVTVDPARDGAEQLREYLAYFDSEFVGLTGEFLQIKRFANQLNTAFVKVRQGPNPQDYTVDHGANITLLNPYGHYHGFIKAPPDATRIKLTLQSIVSTF